MSFSKHFCFFGLFPGVGYARQNSDRSIRTRTYSGDKSAPDPVTFELLERSQSMQRGWRQVHELKIKNRIQEAEIIAVLMKFILQKREGSVRTV